ncbi:hypothetical protein [Leptospira noguchii]|uniref:Uncharacterized protein n=1 Tax=Leptospira noguchii serovar Panama str. CZ214 TaxID=1001595 RepID=T0GRH7_9LEPT|nr:hypothetical protein [Leptospira noguchii]EQA71517.1 hypothetical protein LEP1GSC059_2823 [Leptospira noguchii serovar Panama str. CZ214]
MFPEYKESGNYTITDLNSWCGKEGSRLASQFDSRNGNDYYVKNLNLTALPRTGSKTFTGKQSVN